MKRKFRFIFYVHVFFQCLLLVLHHKLFYKKVTKSTAEDCNAVNLLSRITLDGAGEIRPVLTGHPDCPNMDISDEVVFDLLERSYANGTKCKEVEKRFYTENESPHNTALASMPGSGNTWVRHLLEEATGILTGSVYNSSWIRDIFLGENTTEHVLVVKTHGTVASMTDYNFSRAVVIIRDPFETALSEFNRARTQSKTSILTREDFDRNAFDEKLNRTMSNWSRFHTKWLTVFDGPVFVLFYDKLKSNLVISIAKLCLFLDVPITLEDLICTVSKREGLYHRPPKPEYMSRSNLITSDMGKRIDKEMNGVVDICKKGHVKGRIMSNL